MKSKIIILGILLTSFLVLGGGILNKTIPEQRESLENLELAIYVEKEKTNTIPVKNNVNNYVFDKATCFVNGKEDTSVTISWDSEAWAPIVKGLTTYKTRCDLYFKKMSFNEAILACNQNKNAAECFLENASLNSTELAYDATADNNLRFIGADPNNYVSFNNELWRIIGIFNNIDNGTGTKETRLKIIRSEPYNTSIEWDSNNTNDWTQASLQKELNGTYLNSITSPYKEMISNVKWNLGGLSSSSNIPSSFYTSERGTRVYNGRPTEWTGKIGLMYPSDYGYATSGGSGTDRNTCLNTALFNWDSSSVSDCKNNDWLYDGSNNQWTITPHSSYSNFVFYVRTTRNVGSDRADRSNAVSPALYLISNVKISGGSGSSSDPYRLEI